MKLLATLLIFFLPSLLFSQSKKELKDAGVISRVENTSKSEKGKTTNYKESFERYDDNGNKIEAIEYKSNGDIINYTQFEYNDKGKVIKEKRLNPVNSQPKATINYEYSEDGKLIKELHYDKNNELKKTSEYLYENGLKAIKKTTDSKGKVIETKTYTYEKKK